MPEFVRKTCICSVKTELWYSVICYRSKLKSGFGDNQAHQMFEKELVFMMRPLLM